MLRLWGVEKNEERSNMGLQIWLCESNSNSIPQNKNPTSHLRAPSLLRALFSELHSSSNS